MTLVKVTETFQCFWIWPSFCKWLKKKTCSLYLDQVHTFVLNGTLEDCPGMFVRLCNLVVAMHFFSKIIPTVSNENWTISTSLASRDVNLHIILNVRCPKICCPCVNYCVYPWIYWMKLSILTEIWIFNITYILHQFILSWIFRLT